MLIAERLRALRKEKGLSQGEVERRTGLLRCYISRVENGHTVPTLETLEKLASAFEVPLYVIFYDGEEPPQLPSIPAPARKPRDGDWGCSGKDARFLRALCVLLGKVTQEDRRLLMSITQKMVHRRRSHDLAAA